MFLTFRFFLYFYEITDSDFVSLTVCNICVGPCLFKRLWCNLHIKPPKVNCSDLDLRQRIRKEMNEDITLSRRNAIGSMFALTTFGLISANSYGAGLPVEEKPRLCDDECEKELENVW